MLLVMTCGTTIPTSSLSLQESLQDTECTCDAVTLVTQYFGSG